MDGQEPKRSMQAPIHMRKTTPQRTVTQRNVKGRWVYGSVAGS